MKLNSGYIVSGLVHGSIVAVSILVGMAFVPKSPAGAETDAGPVIVLDPSSGGGSGPAGSSSVSKPVSFPPLKPMDARSILARYDQKLAEERVRNTPKPPRNPDVTSASPGGHVRPVSPRPVESPVGNPSGSPRTTAPAGVTPGIAGVQISGSSGIGGTPGTAPGAGGRQASPAGSLAVFATDLRAKFSEVYAPLFLAKGSELATNTASAEVRLLVSPSGFVRFDGWEREPTEKLFADIIREAVSSMRPVMPPPEGDELTVLINVTGSVVD